MQYSDFYIKNPNDIHRVASTTAVTLSSDSLVSFRRNSNFNINGIQYKADEIEMGSWMSSRSGTTDFCLCVFKKGTKISNVNTGNQFYYVDIEYI